MPSPIPNPNPVPFWAGISHIVGAAAVLKKENGRYNLLGHAADGACIRVYESTLRDIAAETYNWLTTYRIIEAYPFDQLGIVFLTAMFEQAEAEYEPDTHSPRILR
jgi:hypothetical protein